ncbi:ABC transporter permease [Streptomyces sp. NBC_00370]|uniref:ABC transporter permease n=1 Tax=Streptomyces sp. NBC_00370 TaxID=2975728 RepID=UPI002E25E8CD
MSLPAAAHAEWLKVRSLWVLPSSLTGAFLVTTVFSLLICGTLGPDDTAGADFDPLLLSYAGLSFGQLAAIVFGAVAMASEYRAGAIQVSLAAVPDRRAFYTAKLAVVAVLALAVGLVTGLVCFVGGQALIGTEFGIGLGDQAAPRAILGCGLYLTCVSLLAAGVAAVLRSVAGTLSVLVPVFLLLPFVLGDVSGNGKAADFFPGQAGQRMLVLDPSGTPGAWTGLAVLIGWTAATVLAGGLALRRRDA